MMTEMGSQPQVPQSQPTKRLTILVVGTLFALGLIIAGGLFWAFVLGPDTPVGIGWYLFSFSMGLTMIVLPCTLPLAFVIVPLSMGKGFLRGIWIALAFSLGVSITLSMYGILAAVFGKIGGSVFDFSAGGGEVLKNIFYALGGIFAIVFALGQLGFIKARIPTYSGAAPMFIQKQGEVMKAFLLGLFLGNIGVGCPHPATPLILGQIAVVGATTGNIFYGWLLFFIHAVGRIVPLLFLAFLAILGVNATSSLVKRREVIEKATAWGMVFVGGFLFTLGFFTHDWWVNSGTHTLFEALVQESRFTGLLAGKLDVANVHAHGVETGSSLFFNLPLWMGNWALVLSWVIPIWWYVIREKKRIRGIADEAMRRFEFSILRVKKLFFLTLTILLGVLFIYVIPHNFLVHSSMEREEEEEPAIQVILNTDPVSPLPGVPTRLTISLKDDKGKPLTGLEIEHERLLHVIIISEDFSSLGHVHAENLGPITDDMLRTGVFPMEYLFPKAGKYLLSLAFLHEGHSVSKQFVVTTTGLAETPIIVKDLSSRKGFDGYTVSLDSSPDQLRSGDSSTLGYHIEKDGVAVMDLEPYLGAPMHLAVVSVDLSSFTHIHGEIHQSPSAAGHHEVSPGERFGPDIEAHVVFPHPGLYQVFSEFRHQERVLVTRFLVEVGQGSTTGVPSMDHEHE